jgi:hypothetical protein
MCDAGGPNQLADHHWKSGTLDSPWRPDKGHPFQNAPNGAFFILYLIAFSSLFLPKHYLVCYSFAP